jgi:hypothetical protein
MYNYMRVMRALLHRDLMALRIKLPGLLMDSGILLCIQVLNFGYFYPFLGLPTTYIAPLFIGTGIVEFLFQSGFAFSDELIEKIPHKHTTVMEYHLTLPLPKWLLFTEYLLYFMIEKILITLPLIIGGIYLLRDRFAHATGSFYMFALMYLLVVFFVGLFFMALAFMYEYDWFKDNVWSRRLSWFFNFSAIYLLWHVVNGISPVFGAILLCNPFTHAAEGLRSALLGDPIYLPLSMTVPVLCIANLICIKLLARAIINRLDPV